VQRHSSKQLDSCAFAIVTTHWITQQFIPRVYVVEAIAADLDVPLGRSRERAQRLKSMDLKKYVTNRSANRRYAILSVSSKSQEEIHELSLSMQPLKRVLRK